MSDRDITLYILDVFIAIDKVQRFTKKFNNGDELLHSELEWDASIRELQIIGDASNELLKLGLINNSFRRIVDFRNQIAHGYFGIDSDIVWEVVHKKLPIYKNDLLDIVKAEEIDLTEAINSATIENSYNKFIVDFLANLKSKI